LQLVLDTKPMHNEEVSSAPRLKPPGLCYWLLNVYV
jgi:hypothetical protein